MNNENRWRRCSACKEPIELGSTYWVCSVSTCNRKRTALSFCSVRCWEVHLPVARHREAWAVEETAPMSLEAEPKPSSAVPRAQSQKQATASVAPQKAKTDAPNEILIVASRLKEFIRARSGFNTSDGALDPLSEIVRHVCDEAIEKAKRDGRKTVLARDIPFR